MSIFDNEIQSIESMFGEVEHSSYYSNPNNYINSTWLKTKIKEVFKTKEKPSYYLLCAESLMSEVNALTFSLESHVRNIEACAKINDMASNIIKSSQYQNLSEESKDAIRRLASESFRDYKVLIAGDESMSKEEFLGQTAGQSKGIKRIFEIIGQAIKRVILAIANFFKGIFVQIRSYFRKFTYSAMQKNFAAAVQAAKANPQMKITMRNYSKSGFSSGLAKFLQEIPKKSADIQKNYTTVIKSVTEFAGKKANIIDNVAFQTKLKAITMCVDNTAKSMMAAGIQMDKNGRLKYEKTMQMNKLIYGTEKGVGQMVVNANTFLKQVQSAGLDKINMDQVLNAISKGMTDLQSKVTEASKAYDMVKRNMLAQKNGIVRGLLQFAQSSFQHSLSVCKIAIEFYKLASGVLYKAYAQTVKAVVTIAKGGAKNVPAAKGGKKAPAKKK